jgi:hypothetical protein
MEDLQLVLPTGGSVDINLHTLLRTKMSIKTVRNNMV